MLRREFGIHPFKIGGGLSTRQRFFAYNWNWQHDHILFFTNNHNCSAIYSCPVYIHIWYIHKSMYLYDFIEIYCILYFRQKLINMGLDWMLGEIWVASLITGSGDATVSSLTRVRDVQKILLMSILARFSLADRPEGTKLYDWLLSKFKSHNFRRVAL